jgi:hypothetical protein
MTPNEVYSLGVQLVGCLFVWALFFNALWMAIDMRRNG